MKYAEKGKKKMKAFLLAAGLGTRLRPLTNTVPKCLVPVQGKPLLDWWLELLKKNGITEVVINTHYLYEQVRMYIQEYNKTEKKSSKKMLPFIIPIAIFVILVTTISIMLLTKKKDNNDSEVVVSANSKVNQYEIDKTKFVKRLVVASFFI